MSMKRTPHIARVATVLACAASLGGTAIAIAPTAASARAATKCPEKTFTVKPASGGKSISSTAKTISVMGGVGCTEAYAVIRGSLEGKPPNGWTIRPGGTGAPKGYVLEMASKPGKTIKFAVPVG
jgi:hypothetical protein